MYNISMTFNNMLSKFRNVIDEFALIEPNDKIAIGLSGGKDSVTMLRLFTALQKFYPAKFDIMAITIDLGFKKTDKKEVKALKDFVKGLGVEYKIVKSDIAEIVFDVRKETNPCSLCAKMRRGALNDAAKKSGCNKLALAHHKDDFIETFLLSLFYEGRINTFSPKSYMSRSDITLIRPLISVSESEIISASKDYPVVFNPCPADKHTKREDMKNLIKTLEKDIPKLKEKMYGALKEFVKTNS